MKTMKKTLSAVHVLGVFGLMTAGCSPSSKDKAPTDNVGAVAQAVSNLAPSWPTTWVPIARLGVPVADPIGDTQGGAGSSRDLVGTAEIPTAFVQADANHMFFRIRLGTDPQTKANSGQLTPYGWGCEILTDSNPMTYEFLAAVDGIVSPERVSFAANTSQTGKALDDPADKADAPALANYAALLDTVDGKSHARIVADAGSNIGNPGGKNAFIDFAVDRVDLVAAGITAATKFAVVCGSSSSAQSLSADILSVDARRALSEVASDQMTCTDTGCVFDQDSDKDGIADDVEGEGDSDADGIADKLDLDSDNDGIPDFLEGGAIPVDTDNDGTPDYRDLDADGDGLFDADEAGHSQLNVEGIVGGPYGENGLADAVETMPDSGAINYTLKFTDPLQPKPDFRFVANAPVEADSDGDGIPDTLELGPNPAKPVDTDGDGVPDYLDLDSDNDGILDAEETTADRDADGVPNYLDLDSDADGIFDAYEAGSGQKVLPTGEVPGPFGANGFADALETVPDGGKPNFVVRDTDADNAPDCLDTDSDNDGISDKQEKGAASKPVDSDGDGVEDYIDLDADNDGILDAAEFFAALPAKSDFDGDGTPNYLDLDSDGDGILDAVEAGHDRPVVGDGTLAGPYGANGVPNAVETTIDSGIVKYALRDTDADASPDFLDLDSDGDGIPDAVEKGTGATPVDSDGDGVADYRDIDSDNDGLPDAIERGPNGATPVDTDSDGKPDFLDLDSDADGLFDATEAKSGAKVQPNGTILGPYGKNGLADVLETTPDAGVLNYAPHTALPEVYDFQSVDSDGDGIPDALEKGADPLHPVDTDKDGTPDYLDLDSDDDGIADNLETDKGLLVDTDGDGTPDFRDLDSDGDTIPDSAERGEGEMPVDTDMDGTPDFRDLDADGDAVPDKYEAGADPSKPTDSNSNGIPDFQDPDADMDKDGIPNEREFGGKDGPIDTDKDGTPDYLDADSDGDGLSDAIEAGKDATKPVDTDMDGTPDYLDLDSDDDGIADAIEAGKDASKPVDTDLDGTPDFLDRDSDGDGIPDAVETADDADKDGTPNYIDLDSDGDTIPDAIERGMNGASPVDTDMDGTADYLDLDSDGDAIKDAVEAGTDGSMPVDTDKDGAPDYLDLDSDGDTLLDSTETDADFDKDGAPNYLDLDSDNDCLLDEKEANAGTQLDPTMPGPASLNCGAGQVCDTTKGACVPSNVPPEELALEGGGPSCTASSRTSNDGWGAIAGLALGLVAVRRRRAASRGA